MSFFFIVVRSQPRSARVLSVEHGLWHSGDGGVGAGRRTRRQRLRGAPAVYRGAGLHGLAGGFFMVGVFVCFMLNTWKYFICFVDCRIFAL